MLLQARYVVPVGAPAIEGGAVQVRDGKIAAVAPASELTDRPATDFGDAVILPGFVNAHTHFELSSLAGKVPPDGDFVDWLRRLVQMLSALRPDEGDVTYAVRKAVGDSLACGVTCIGDITRWADWTRPVLAASPMRGVSFGEVIAMGSGRNRLEERLAAAASRQHETARLRCGISPHSPYTVEPPAMRSCAARAAELSARLCVHAAESLDEIEFASDAGGRLGDFLRDVGIWDDGIVAAGQSPIEMCREAGLLGPRTVLAHANYAGDDDLQIIAESGSSVAYCPRTHAAFWHPPHRFREMLRAGINVCVGTDSLASNPSLSVLDELRHLRATYPDFPAEELVRMGTIRGAAALGLARTVGTIEPGKAADLVVIPLERCVDRWETILQFPAKPRAVYIDGVQTSLRG